MKTLLLILLLVPMIGFGQTAEEYHNRGNEYMELEKYYEAIAEYSKAIKLNPDDADAYYNRGIAYRKLGNYKDAIVDYSSAIKINPDDAYAYKNRGIAKKNSGLPYCSDYKRACDLGEEECCEWYYKQCK